MAAPGCEAPAADHEALHLARPVFEVLDHPAILRFRKDYQLHRLGYAKGAKGEVGAALRKVAEKQQQQQQGGVGPHTSLLPEGISGNEAANLLSPFAAYAADSPFATDEALLAQIARWRMAYQNFRTGAARGAAGALEEISKGLSLKALKLLPVVQLAEVLQRDKQPKGPHKLLPTPHLHFGAGKLGCGLVLQAMLRSNVEDLVVLQRQSEDFEPLLSAAKREGIPVFVNGEKVCELRVYVHPNEIEELIQKLENKKLQNSKSPGHTSTHLVLTNDSELALKLAKAAKSLSCSLGPAMETALLPLLSQLPDTPKTEQVLLYACENDHAAVARLKEQLQQKVLVLPCMVDRICAARNIFADKIEVSAEPYEGEIVVLERPQFAPPPPFGGPNVHAPQLRAAAHYLCQRKIGLVNGMHTTLAFLTACSRRDELLAAAKEAAKPRTARSSSSSSSSGSSSSADAEGSSSSSSSSESPDPLLVALRSVPLLKETEMQQQQKETMWAWLTARCLQVLWEHDKEVIKRTHNLKTDDEVVAMLLNYGKKTLARFSTVDDTAGRVLGGGVVNRFHTRLLTIYTFLEQHMFGSVPLASTLLKHATISAFEMIDEVRRLVDQSRIFVEK